MSDVVGELWAEIRQLRARIEPVMAEMVRLHRLERRAIDWAHWRAGQCDTLNPEEARLIAEVEP